MRFDPWLFFSVLALVGIGIVMVYSTSSIYASDKFGDGAYFLKKHLLSASLGLVLMIGTAMVPEKIWWSLALPSMGIVILSLILVAFTPLGRTMGGSSRWLRVGGIGCQPAEFAKFALVLYLSRSFVKKGGRVRTFEAGFLPHAVLSGVLIALILVQPDFGTAMVIGTLSMLMMFAGGVKVSHMASLGLMAGPLLYHLVMGVDYRRRRVLAFLNPWDHAHDSAFQVVQSFIAFGSGGLFGQGLGKGRQKLFYLPEAHTDFIFSCIGEEAGLVGVILVVSLFSIIIWRGMRASIRARSPFQGYCALGATLLIGIQAMVNMWVTLGILPTKGLTLPFVSYGGSSLIVNLLAVGIIMGVSGIPPSPPFTRGGTHGGDFRKKERHGY